AERSCSSSYRLSLVQGAASVKSSGMLSSCSSCSPGLSALFLAFLAACSSSAPNGTGGSSGDVEPQALTGITAAHNAARAAVQPQATLPIPPLIWSATIASVAQSWAENCEFQHSDGQHYGENLAATVGPSGTWKPEDIVAGWVNESKNYDY